MNQVKISQVMDKASEVYDKGKPELHVSLDGFEGPLDLLLTLAKSQKVDLKKIQVGILAEQFLNFLKEQRLKVELESAGDYLVMASWLTFLKSQLIIPEDDEKHEDVDKINELLALRLQRLSLIRDKANWIFDRPQLQQNFFPSSINSYEKVIKEECFNVQLTDIFKAYLEIEDKKNFQLSMDSKDEYLFLDRAISFIERQVKDSKTYLNFSTLVKEIHAMSGIKAKRCAASIFCGLLEYTKLGKIQLKQENTFSRLELTSIDVRNKG